MGRRGGRVSDGCMHGWGKQWGWGEGFIYPACAVADHEHEAAAFAAVGVAFGVQGRETDAVLLDAVGEGPVVDELEAGGHEEADLFGEGAGEDLGGGSGAGVDAAEGERGEGRGLEGRGGAGWGGVDAVVHARWRLRGGSR